MTWQERYMARFYDPGRGWVDGTTEFHQMCAARIASGSRILEIGAGPSNPTSAFLSTLGELTGVDPDPAVVHNRSLRVAEVLKDDRFPFSDGSFDACVSNYVLEHVLNPSAHLSEVRRVLRPAGVYVFRTPNRYHYVAMIARLTPHSFHELVANWLRGRPEGSPDPYPTAHLLNSTAAVCRSAARQGFRVAELRLVEKEPSYGFASRLLFLPMLAYERVANATDRLAWLRANIFAVLQREG